MDILATLNILDKSIHEDQKKIEIVVCGGFVIWQRYGIRPSDDIDSLSIDQRSYLQQKLIEISKKFSVGTNWLNWQAVDNLNINLGLESGWDERAKSEGPIYQGTSGSLIIYGLSRSDLIATKMSAYIANERSKDLDDLRAIQTSSSEIENIADKIIHLILCRGNKITAQFGDKKGVEFIKRAISFIAKNEVEKK